MPHRDVIFTSEENLVGQKLWWGMHLLKPGYLKWSDDKIKAYRLYDNSLKFLDEAREAQAWYFAFRNVQTIKKNGQKYYLKYVCFDNLSKGDQKLWRLWEQQYPPTPINPEPDRKCIFRNDYLTFKKVQLVKRYHELMAKPPERNFENDQKIMDTRWHFKNRLRTFLKSDEEGRKLKLLGIIRPEPVDPRDVFKDFGFNPDEQHSLDIIYDYLPKYPEDAKELKAELERKLGKTIELNPWSGFSKKDRLDLQLCLVRTKKGIPSLSLPGVFFREYGYL
tara:strand:- start:251 stop:1084 length:834 start_codon:yes stop_codon:yes gene_type:complete